MSGCLSVFVAHIPRDGTSRLCDMAESSLLFVAHAIEDGMDIIGDVVPLLHAIQDHAFGDGDHVGRDLVQDADNGAFVAIVRDGVGNKGEQLVRQLFLIIESLE